MGRNLIAKLVEASRTRIQTQGNFTREALTGVVDEVIDEFMRDGLITDDANIEVITVEVRKRLEQDLI